LKLRRKLNLNSLTCQTPPDKPNWGILILYCAEDALRRPGGVAGLSSVDAALFFSKRAGGGGIVFDRSGELP
jgi:hypothetical protein